MNFINALSAWQWALLAAIPPAIVLLYFLKLKRQPIEVPSTYLWTRTIEDLHVNTIWQRLRQSLLLFLQLLLIALAIIACLRPGWRSSELIDERVIFLIDNSASMSSTDVSPTRLDEAKRRVLSLVDQMTSNQVAMVISFSDVQRVEQSFTNSRSTLRQKVNRIRPTNRRSNLSDALRAAAGLANPGRTSEAGNVNDIQVADALPAVLYIFSDGGFESVPNFSLGNLTPNYIPIGEATVENVGITTFSAVRNPERPDQIQAFARVQNSGVTDKTVAATLFLDGEIVDASNLEIPADEATGVTFKLPSVEEGVLRLETDHEDSLDTDNVAYSVLNLPRRAEVAVVTPGNPSLRAALTTEEAERAGNVQFFTPDVLATENHKNQALSGVYDLIIYDQCVPEEMPASNTFFIGNLPPLDSWTAGELKPTPIIVDTDPAHPLTHFVQMGDVKWNLEGFPVTGPEGATVLFDADIGPLLVIGHREAYEDLVLGFEIISIDESGASQPKTEWPVRRSFPVFFMNVLRYLGGARSAMAMIGVQPGMPISLRSIYPVDEMTIDTPGGGRHEVLREGQNKFVFSSTHDLGVYEVREGSEREASQKFAVNLFDSRESDLRPREAIELGYETVEGRAGLEPSRMELWKWLLIGGLGVLLFEWYVYNRRVYL